MKRRFLIIFLITLTLPFSLQGQKKLSAGVWIGTSFNQISGLESLANELSIQLSALVGKEFPVSCASRNFVINAGGFLQYDLLPWLSLKGGLEFNPKGEKLSGEVYLSTNMNMESEVLVQSTILKLAYLDFPFTVQLATKGKKKAGATYMYFETGLSPSYLISSKMDITVSDVERGFNSYGPTSKTLDSQNEVKDIDSFRKNDTGIIGALGICFSKTFIDLKVCGSTKNILSHPNGIDSRNTMILLRLGFRF
jgi:hypothetical protein